MRAILDTKTGERSATLTQAEVNAFDTVAEVAGAIEGATASDLQRDAAKALRSALADFPVAKKMSLSPAAESEEKSGDD